MWFLEMYYSLRLTGKNERSHNYWPGYFSNQPHSAVPKEQRIPAGITPWGWLQIRYFPLGFKSAVFTNSMGKYPLKYLFNGVKTLKDNHSYKLNCLYQYVFFLNASKVFKINKIVLTCTSIFFLLFLVFSSHIPPRKYTIWQSIDSHVTKISARLWV